MNEATREHFDRKHTFNVGYTYGVDKYYHNREPYSLFLEWLARQHKQQKQTEKPFYEEFEAGFEAGYEDYLKTINVDETNQQT